MINTYVKAGLLGVFAGMRSMSAPTLLSHIFANNGYKRIKRSPLKFLGNSSVANTLKAAALGEFIVDKLPKTPARTEPGSLAFRAASGALSGAAIAVAEKKNLIFGSLLGGMGAIASAYLFKYLRQRAGRKSDISNAISGLAEDAVLIGSGLTVMSKGF